MDIKTKIEYLGQYLPLRFEEKILEKEIAEMNYENVRTLDHITITKDKILRALSTLEDGAARTVLIYRFIHGYRWGVIAVKLNCSLRKVHYLKTKALEEIRIDV